MSLRIRRGGGPSTSPEPPPDPGAAYTFPTTTYRFPHLPDDEGHTSHASCSAASGGNPTADGIICVRDYGAVGNGTTDDTAAIQSAIEQNINENESVGIKKTIYFPDGTYRLTGLSGNMRGILERRQADGEWRTGLRIQGESETGTILKLDDNVFTNASAPRFVIFLGSKRAFPTANVPHYLTDATGLAAYNHHVSDLTINLGIGNTGAIGINAAMHNSSALRRITVIGTGSGVGNFSTYAYAGVCAERQGVGPGMWERITVKGCQYGVRIAETMCGHCIEHLKLENQGTVGVLLNTNGLVIRGLTSTSTKPVAQAIGNQINHFGDTTALLALGLPHAGGTPYSDNDTYPVLAIVDAEITGTGAASGVSAIDKQAGKVFLRNISTTGYARAAEDEGTAVPGGDDVTEYSTTPSQNLWGQSGYTSLNLPIVNTPEHPYPVIGGMTLANVTNSGQPPAARVDITAELQTAIDNCMTDTLYFPSNRGRYFVYGNTTIVIRGNVRHIMGNGSQIYIDQNRTNPLFRIDTVGAGPPVIIEDLWPTEASSTITIGPMYQINTPRDVVWQDGKVAQVTNTSLATGRLFMNNVLAPQFQLDYPQDAWCRMFNADGGFGVTKWTGGNLWILYWKSEYGGRAVQTMTGGAYEEIGGWHSLIFNPDPGVPLYTFTNCDFSLDGVFTHEGAWAGGGSWSQLVQETQGGITRRLDRSGAVVQSGSTVLTQTTDPRGGGKHLTLVRSRV